ncbi:TnpV protein [Coprobacillaceae bacterium CR2/5/TPMF4]|nr:TnpV protein [Coprobacillaceae bacterium CR2/5/TPMF4]
MKLIYTRNGDYLFPNLTIKNQSTNGINKYGYLRLRYLKENKKALYTTLLMTNELTNHLISVSKNSEDRLQILMENYKNSDKNYLKKIKRLII